MAQQKGNGGRGTDNPQQGRQEDRQQQDERRSASGSQQGQPGKDAGPVLPAGEKVGEWSEEDRDEGLEADAGKSDRESGGAGYSAPSEPGSRREAESEAPTRPGFGGSRRSGPGSGSGSGSQE